MEGSKFIERPGIWHEQKLEAQERIMALQFGQVDRRLERIESLEQLRALEAGWRIAVSLAPSPFPPGVDTPDDLARAQRLYQAQQGRLD